MSFASASGFSPTASIHRRSASAGDEVKRESRLKADAREVEEENGRMTDVEEARTLDAGSVNRPRAKSRLSFSGFKFGRSQSRSKKQRSSTVAVPLVSDNSPRWTVQEVNTLAESSLRYWKSGVAADQAAMASDLGRSTREVSEMLEYILQGYARFGGTPSWADQSPEFIMGWAALEFPRNPLLNPQTTDLARLPSSVSRLEACISALRCTSRVPMEHPAFSIDGKKTATSSQNIVADFREGMRLQGVEPSPPQRTDSLSPSSAPSLTASSARAPSRKSTRSNAAAIRDSINTQTRPKSSSSSSCGGSAQPTADVSKPANPVSESLLQPLPKAAMDTDKDAQSNTPKSGSQSSIPVFTAGSQPVFTGGLRSRQTLTTLNRPARGRRARRSSFRHETGSFGFKYTADEANMGEESPVTYDANSKKDAEVAADQQPAPPSPEPSRPRASTVAHTSLAPANGTENRRSQDSGHIDELSPDQSQNAIDVIQPVRESNGDIDAQFPDISSEARQKVRRFVDRFVTEYAADFQQRVDAYMAGRDGLCITVDHFADFEYNNDAYLKAIETIYRYIGGSVLYTCNIFFHVQLLHAIRLDHIPVTDDSWLRVNEFATRVFNKRIKDARYLVMHEYAESAESAANAPGGGWLPAARNGRLDSFTGSEGNEHSSPFERAFYMDKLACRYVKFILDVKREDVARRVRENGPRPMPVALQADEATMLPLDIEIRNMIIAFIWEDIPQATLESKEVTLLRALEMLNVEFAERCGFNSRGLQSLLEPHTNVDGDAAADPDITSVTELSDMPATHQAQVIGKAFAHAYFHDIKYRFLEAMLHDHPFRPVSRDELKEWSIRGSGPFGEDVDYMLNTRLYKFLRRVHMRPTSKQWLNASAAATLSMIRRTLAAAVHKDYLAHIDVTTYETRFKEIVLDMRGGSASTASSIGFPQSINASKLRLSAFGRRPGPAMSNGSARPQGSAAIRYSPRPLVSPSLSAQRGGVYSPSQNGLPAGVIGRQETSPSENSNTRHQQMPAISQISLEIPSSRAADNGSDGSSHVSKDKDISLLALPSSSVTGQAASTSVPPAKNGTQRMHPQPPTVNVYDQVHPSLHQHPSMVTQSPMLSYTVPMPGNSYPMPMAHIYTPYAQIDPSIHHHQFQQMPVFYANSSAPAAAPNGSSEANMATVLQKFEEMQLMLRQLQSQQNQT
ncbi:hypothetical protein GGI15_002106 [Coemansia interrupta]|uniref:Uncharacterized protein n=1 Tax=Coemansia interrupta TaxID=1126814 RepID=A0A9W8HFI0_9FUNG|nr:hypothetical protein GGI15_002106 [Coemansia interrupta]